MGVGGVVCLFLFFFNQGLPWKSASIKSFSESCHEKCQCIEGCHESVPVLSLLLRAASVKSLSLLPRTFVEKCQC